MIRIGVPSNPKKYLNWAIMYLLYERLIDFGELLVMTKLGGRVETWVA